MLVATGAHHHERLGAGLHVLDRSPQPLREDRREQELGIPLDLGAEAAADVGLHDSALALGDAQVRRERVAQRVRDLRRRPDRESILAPVGEHHARLHRRRVDPVVVESQRRPMGCLGEHVREVVGPRRVEQHVRADRRVQDRGAVGHRLRRRQHDGQGRVLDHDAVDGVSGEVGGFGRHHCHRLTDEADAITSEQRTVHPGDPGNRTEPGEVVDGVDAQHAVEGDGRRRVDRRDLGVRLRAHDEGEVDGARQLDVVDVGAPAGDEVGVFLADDPCSDHGWQAVPFSGRPSRDERIGRSLDRVDVSRRCQCRCVDRGHRPRVDRGCTLSATSGRSRPG